MIENELKIKNILLSLDFSKANPSHKERLRQELADPARVPGEDELGEDELGFVSAAGDTDGQQNNTKGGNKLGNDIQD
jgi:hypothetical protein